ncbi:DUF1264 domain protein [Gymnopilus junonius]|uniref:DUF1264 domain protein n=1 Tax=Gymnopilus junonius TaxID=109634 RepID=A0A9P5NUH6_GYMJU|nr:DUF1264 domain protein [Gymnopilus junonius]
MTRACLGWDWLGISGSSVTSIPLRVRQRQGKDGSGEPLSPESRTLNAVSGLVQEFEPLKNVCGYLNAFHLYADEPSKFVEAHHYCASLNEDFRQCLIYESGEKNARLIGTLRDLEESERRLWHSHVFEIKSGMLIMPKPSLVPEAAWEIAENKEMEQLIQVYGKIYHTWQVDRGDPLPIGAPKLMTSVTEEAELHGGLLEKMKERDKKLVADYNRKKEARKELVEPKIHPDYR